MAFKVKAFSREGIRKKIVDPILEALDGSSEDEPFTRPRQSTQGEGEAEQAIFSLLRGAGAGDIPKFDRSGGPDILSLLQREQGPEGPEVPPGYYEGRAGIAEDPNSRFPAELGGLVGREGATRGTQASRERPYEQPPLYNIAQTYEGTRLAQRSPGEAAVEDILAPFEQEYLQERPGIEAEIEDLERQIEILSGPLRSSAGGTPQTLNGIYEALERGGPDAAEAYFNGLQNRRAAIGDLEDERDELNRTLIALDNDGSSPRQAYRDFIANAPNIDGLNLPNVDPTNLTPEDARIFFGRALQAYAADGNTPGERANSGYSGVLGTNLDGWQTLLNDGKVVLDEQGMGLRRELMETDDWIDYISLDMRFNSEEFLDPSGEEVTATAIMGEVIRHRPELLDQPRSATLEVEGQKIPVSDELKLMVEAILWRVNAEVNTGQGGTEEWLQVLERFRDL